MTNAPPFPKSGRLAAIDFGTVRIGVAVCDPDWILASPLAIRNVTTPESDATYFRELVRQERIAGFVVGLPIHCDGGESEKSIAARKFAIWLSEATDIPVRLFDERFTTVAATHRISGGKLSIQQKKQRLDAVAAQVLLESFLEACRYHGDLAGHAVDAESMNEQPLDD